MKILKGVSLLFFVLISSKNLVAMESKSVEKISKAIQSSYDAVAVAKNFMECVHIQMRLEGALDTYYVLHRAVQTDKPNIIEMAIKLGYPILCKDETPLILAARLGLRDAFITLISFNSSWEHLMAKDLLGQTVLHVAAKKGHCDIILLCLAELKKVSQEAVVNAVNDWDDNENTPLDLALAKHHADVVEILKQHGAKESLII